MIGRRCKAGDSLSRAALIARALTRRIPAGAVPMCLAGATQLRSKRDTRSGELAVRPPGHAEGHPSRGRHVNRLKTSAAHRSAAMAGGARPDPFRTRKLSRRAPMVLRGQPVGEQGAADRWTALDPYQAGSGAGAPRGLPPRRPLSLSVCVIEGPPGPFFVPRPLGASWFYLSSQAPAVAVSFPSLLTLPDRTLSHCFSLRQLCFLLRHSLFWNPISSTLFLFCCFPTRKASLLASASSLDLFAGYFVIAFVW